MVWLHLSRIQATGTEDHASWPPPHRPDPARLALGKSFRRCATPVGHLTRGATLAKRHLTNGTLVLYDVSSSYMEGSCCPLAKRGYSRDGKKGTLQIVYGLLCAPDGCPVAIEVFDGNTADPTTLAPQIEKLKQRFGLDHVRS